MWTTPSTNDLIESILISLNNDVAPDVRSDRAKTSLGMIQALLTCIAQRTPVEQQLMAAEHNQMTATIRDVAALTASASGPAAARIQERARTLGAMPDLAPIPAWEDIWTSHRELSSGLVSTLDDLDELLRGGDEAAERALGRLREHLGPRTAIEFATYVAGAGMVGRG